MKNIGKMNTVEKSSLQLVFLIVCHRKTPALLYTLKKLSKFKNTKVIVHIDKKSDLEEGGLVVARNISYFKEVDIFWGGVSQVALTNGLLLRIQKEDYDYVSLLSGDDVFIKSEEEFIDFLISNNGKEFIGLEKDDKNPIAFHKRFLCQYPHYFFDASPNSFKRAMRYYYRILFLLQFKQNKIKAPYPRFYKGSNWFTISKSAASVIISEIKSKKLLDYFSRSFCIDEVVFQTILMNNNFADKIYLDNSMANDNRMSLRYINWIDGPDFPKILNKEDLSVKFDDDIFFVRKVSEDIQENELSVLFG